MRIVRIALLVVLVLAASGCGAAKKSTATGGASLVPASAPAFVSIDSDATSYQWRKVDSLLKKFPGRSQALAAVRSELQGAGLDYGQDVKPALGPELDIVWLDLADGGSNAVVLTQPKDEAKFKAMIAKGNASDTEGSNVLTGKIGDWTAVSDEQAKIDRLRTEAESGTKLADDAAFKDVTSQLADDTVVTAFARGKSLAQALSSMAPSRLPPGTLGGAGTLDYVAVALEAKDNGLRFVGAARSTEDTKAAEFRSKLVEDVPGDALLVASFRGGGQIDKQLGQLNSNPTYRQGLGQFEKALGVKLASVLGLFKGEVVFYVRPQAPVPEFSLVGETEDAQSSLATVDKIMAGLHAKVTTGEGGAKQADFGQFVVHYTTFDENLFITNGDQAIQGFRTSGDKLPDAQAYKDARSAAGVPAETAGFFYVDLKDGIPLLERYAGIAGTSIPLQVRENLAPLRSLLSWSTLSGRTTTANLFLQIQ